MLNSTGTQVQTHNNQKQILADVENQSSIGCVVNTAIGITVGSQKIAKAGTPVNIDLSGATKLAALATASVAMTGVLLHDVDVTSGNNNGTALLFGFVNLNRIDSDVQTLITTARTNANASKLVTFLKV